MARLFWSRPKLNEWGIILNEKETDEGANAEMCLNEGNFIGAKTDNLDVGHLPAIRKTQSLEKKEEKPAEGQESPEKSSEQGEESKADSQKPPKPERALPVPISWIKAELNTAYLECLLLDRERFHNNLQRRESYRQAYVTATKMMEHLRLIPSLQMIIGQASQSKTPQQLAVHLDYIYRELGDLMKESEDKEFFHSLQTELGYLLPRLWHPPEEQEQKLKQLEDRVLRISRLYDNNELSRQLVVLKDREDHYSLTLRAIDMSLAKSWPKQLGLIVSNNATLILKIQEHSKVAGLNWKVYDNPKEASQNMAYQDPALIVSTLEQPRAAMEKLCDEFSRAEALVVIDEMSSVDEANIPRHVGQMIEERWLHRFLPTLVHKQLMRRWRDTHQRDLDSLTGLPTPLGGRLRFEQLQELFTRMKDPFCFAVLDLPHLPEIEKREGPYLASEWLRSFAHSMQSYLRGTDILCRWQPNKFVLMLPYTSLKGSLIALERCQQRLSKDNPITTDSNDDVPLFQAGVITVQNGMLYEEALLKSYQHLKYADKSGEASGIYFDPKEVEAGQNSHILLLDDDPVVQEMLRYIFSREGYQVTQMTNGSNIIEMLEKESVSLIILDVKMPGIDGFEVLEMIRSRRKYDSLPIVMLTSLKSEADIAKGFDLGADDYLYKPFSPSELVIRTRRFLKK